MKKCILWIDDFDIKSATRVRQKNKPQMEEGENKKHDKHIGLFDELYKDLIEVKTTMLDGLEYIKEHYGEFDCVILDINLNKNLQQINEEDINWKFLLDNINLDDIEDIEDEFRNYGGFYIVLLLIALGFPKDRIIMFTAFGSSCSKYDYKPVEKWSEKFRKASMYCPHVIEKGNCFINNVDGKKHKEMNEYLKKLYKYDDYYYTRLFLYKLYNVIFLLKKERTYDETNLLFNKICKNKSKRVGLNDVGELVNNVINFFQFIKPVNTNNIFFNALKYFSEPFEADYNIKNGKVEDDTYRLIKIFRNWSSHNLIKNRTDLKDDMFRFIFFIQCLLFTRCENDDICELLDISKEFFSCDIEDINLVEYINDRNWRICEAWSDIPKDMIGVYERRGRICNNMKLIYLFDIYLNCFIDSNIKYDKYSWHTEYSLSLKCENQINKILLNYTIKMHKLYCIGDNLS